MLKIAVVDAQGGGLGASIVKSLLEKCGERVSIVALGTNAIATSAMRKAGEVLCATGENAVCVGVHKADVIIGGVGIIASCGMMGEITAKMAAAVAESDAKKILVPVNKCNIIIPGVSLGVKELIEMATDEVASML